MGFKVVLIVIILILAAFGAGSAADSITCTRAKRSGRPPKGSMALGFHYLFSKALPWVIIEQ